MPAPELPKEEWDAHKDVIVKYFRKLTAKQLLEYLNNNHGFCPTSSQLESRLKKWGLRKNVHKEQWQRISAADQQQLENGKAVVMMDGVIIDRKKWNRAKKWARRQRSTPMQEDAALQRGEDGINARAPSTGMELCTDTTSDTPFSQFDTKFDLFMMEFPKWRFFPIGTIHPHAQLGAEASFDPFTLYFFNVTTSQIQAPGGSPQSPCDSHAASLPWSKAGTPNQDAEKIMSDILGADVDPDSYEYSKKIAARLQEVMTKQAEGDAVRQIDQFTKDSKVDQTFRLLRYAVYLASNNLLPVERVASLLQWLLHSNTFWVVDVFVAMRTPTTDVFASVLLVGAARLGNFTACQLLLKRGVEPNCTAPSLSYRTSTALLEAVRHQDTDLVSLLVNSGAEFNVKMTSMPSPLGQAVLSDNLDNSRAEIIGILINKGADIHQVMGEAEAEGATILDLVLDYDDSEVTTMFLQSDAGIGSLSKQYSTPLKNAAEVGNLKLVERLLKSGANVNGCIGSESVDSEIGSMQVWRSCALSTPLEVALAENHLAVAAVLLREGADVNGVNARERLRGRTCSNINISPLPEDDHCHLSGVDLRVASSPLQIAAQNGSIAMGRLLLKLGARVNTPGNCGTALQLAATKRGNLDFLKLLLENGANVNAPAPEPQGCTALQAAVELGDGDIIELLLNHGANVNAAPSSEGFTAVQAAASRGETLLVAKLIQQGADVNAPAAAEHGFTALQVAIEEGWLCMVDLLLRKGANIFAPGALTGGCSALEAAMNEPLALNTILLHAKEEDTLIMLRKQVAGLLSAIHDGNYNEVTALLLKYGIQLSSSDLQRPLQIAIEKGNVSLAKKWIDAGADVQMCLRGPYGDSIMAAAVATGSPDFCALLIESHADLEGDRGTHALLVAASNNDLRMLEYLLSKGANPNWDNPCEPNRLSPVAKVFEPCCPANRWPEVRQNREKMFSVLLQHGANLKGVAFPGHVCSMPLRMLQRLCEYGWEVNRRLPEKDSLLQYATEDQMEDVVELLLDTDADINAPPAPTSGNTALQIAVSKQNVRLVTLFLSKGADVNGPPSPEHGATALQRAVMVGSMPIFVLLLKNGADVNAPAALVGGRTALEAAAEYGRLDMSHILLHKDKEPETLWLRCQRAAKLAASHGFPILAREFREWKISGFDKPWERDLYAQFEVSSR